MVAIIFSMAYHWVANPVLLKAMGKFAYPTQSSGIASLCQQMAIPTLYIVYQTKRDRNIVLGAAAPDLGVAAPNLGAGALGLGVDAPNLRAATPNLRAGPHNLWVRTPSLGAAAPRLRYHYLSLFYLYQQGLILSQTIENQFNSSY